MCGKKKPILIFKVKVAQWCPSLCKLSRPEYWSGQPFPSPRDLPKPGIEPGSPTLQAYSLLVEPPGNPNHTGEGSLSLLQGIFPTQESNWDLLYCRQILYQLSYQGSQHNFESETESHSVVSLRLFETPWTVDGILQARILECVAFPFSRGPSQPRDQTQVSHTAGGFFTS